MQEQRAGDKTASQFYAFNLPETKSWPFCASHPWYFSICSVLWVGNMWTTTFSPEKAALSPDHHTSLPLLSETICLAFVPCREDTKWQCLRGWDLMAQKLTQKVRTVTQNSSPEGPKPQTRQGLQQLRCYTLAPVTLAWFRYPSTKTSGHT